jgi:ubiquinone biosynthesis protein
MFRGLRHAWRLVGIARILARHRALDAVDPLLLPPWPRLALGLLTRAGGRDGARPGERLARALVELGPSFIKLGQSLATRPDVIGAAIAEDLSRLQDRLPPFPVIEARQAIEDALGRPMGELFASFEDQPVAAASIAQVHFAVTSTGEPVAVKVLRPGIERAFAGDMDFFLWLAEMVERWHPAFRRLRPIEAVRTIARAAALEMDLRLEAAAASELAGNFVGDPDFRVPQVDWHRTARRVLTTERVIGVRSDDREAVAAAGHDPREIVAKAAATFFRQVFRDGFFHADMHPGNMFIDAEGAIVAVDFGIMVRIDQTTRYFLADMLLGFLNADYRAVAEVHFRAGFVPPHHSPETFMQACRAIGEPILGLPQNEISIARLLAQLFEVTEFFDMEVQPQLLLLQRTMVVAEGVGRQLDPSINMWQLARPLIEEWMRENRGPEARLAETLDVWIDAGRRLPKLIGRLDRLVGEVEQGGLKLHPDTARLLRGDGRARPILWAAWAAVTAAIAAALVAWLS